MGPKTPKTPVSKGKSQDEEKEDVLQAVIIADTFENKFGPFTLERPRCLLPLANVPILEYTLDFVAQSGVQEVFISAGPHSDQVEKFVNASKWKQATSPFKKVGFLKSAATSFGDVMRDLDQKGLISGDFLSVSGDVISNYPVAEALKIHKARRQKDKNGIMTMLLLEAGQSQQRSRTSSIISTFVLDPTTDRCLHYEEGRLGERDRLAIDPDMLSRPELEIRQDLVDCRIDICTPEMLSLWSDNFDNQSPRKDFLHGVLKDYELNGKTIHAHVFRDHFADRVGSLRAYDRLSRNITSRWTFPACPDALTSCKFSRRGTYREDGVTLARTCRVKPKSIVGRGTSIGDRSLIQNSIIGRYCQIGRNVQVVDSYIWDYTVVEDDASITHAIVADEAFIGRKCIVGQGALISFGVRIEQGRNISAGSRITKARNAYGDSATSDDDLVGAKGEGHLFQDDEYDEPDSQFQGLVYRNETYASSRSSLESTDLQDSELPTPHTGSRSESFATTASDEDGTDRFHHEAVLSVFERMKKGTKQDDVRVELMGLRFAQNAAEHQVRRAAAVALMKHISYQSETGKIKIPDAVHRSLVQYRSLIQRVQCEDAATADQVNFLLEAQADLVHRKQGPQILLHLVKELYDQNLFDEEVVQSWWDDERSESSPELKASKESSRPFLDWLLAADEESDSDEGSDSGDE